MTPQLGRFNVSIALVKENKTRTVGDHNLVFDNIHFKMGLLKIKY